MLRYWINRWRKIGLKVSKRFEGRTKEMQILGSIIGKKCKICGRMKNIRYHEIHGKKHEHSTRYILNHALDFVPLCQRCHSTLHYAKRVEKLPEIRRKRLVRLLSILT
jgi:hypothetical protein